MKNYKEFDIEYSYKMLSSFNEEDRQKVQAYMESFFTLPELEEFKTEAQSLVNERNSMDMPIKQISNTNS